MVSHELLSCFEFVNIRLGPRFPQLQARSGVERDREAYMWIRSLGLMLAIVLSAAGTSSAQTPDDKRTVEDLRAAVLRLPYYGVFDAVSVNYDKGTATLTGFVYQPRLKEDIVNAVKRVARVDDV